MIRVAPRLQGSLIYCIAARRLSPTVHRPAPRSAAARRSWAAAPGARCWSGRRQGWGTGSARGSAWRACPPVPFPALAPGHRILLRGTGGHPLTPPDLTPGRDQSATTGVMTRSFAGLAPPRTARSVTAGIASLAPTRCARTTWTPSSGARRLTWQSRGCEGAQLGLLRCSCAATLCSSSCSCSSSLLDRAFRFDLLDCAVPSVFYTPS